MPPLGTIVLDRSSIQRARGFFGGGANPIERRADSSWQSAPLFTSFILTLRASALPVSLLLVPSRAMPTRPLSARSSSVLFLSSSDPFASVQRSASLSLDLKGSHFTS